MEEDRKNARGQNTQKAGSDPTFDGFQPPKSKWGRSRPSPNNGDRVLPACRSRRIRGVVREVTQTR